MQERTSDPDRKTPKDSTSVGPSAATSSDIKVSSPDRKTLNILLAALDIEQNQLAELMGYDKGYVRWSGSGRSPR